MKKLKEKNNNYKFYNFATSIIRKVGNLYFNGEVIGKENIPKNGRCILAGNHVSNYDSYLLFLSTKRPIHILAKKELFESKFKKIFELMHLIPIDRKNKNPEAKEEVIKLLSEEKVIGIFPEGTFHKETIILPFKPGVISFAEKTSSLIIPFAIIGKFKFRSKPRIIFGKTINISEIQDNNKVEYLENVIKEMIINQKENDK